MKNKIRAWMLFDIANQPFHTLVVTFIYIPYFNKFIAGGEAAGQVLVSWMAGLSAIAVAIMAPVISAITDKAGYRKRWMLLFSAIFIIGCTSLAFTDNVAKSMAAYILAYCAAEMTLITINAYLPELSDDPRRVGEISGKAWGYGYLGGIALLIVFLVFVMPVEGKTNTLVGLKALLGPDAAVWSGPASALWYFILMIPFFLLFKDQRGDLKAGEAVKEGMSSLKTSLGKSFEDLRLRWFFLSSLLYRDALGGLFVFGAIYAQNVLGWTTTILGAYGIALNLTGVIGGVAGGWFDKKRGGSFVVKASLWIFMILCFAVMSTNREKVIFIPVSQDSHLPDIVFFICGLFIGIGSGALQGASRGMVVPETKAKMTSGEAFGIYGMMGRATAFIAPLLVGVITAITGSSQMGVWPIFILFVISYFAFRYFEKQ